MCFSEKKRFGNVGDYMYVNGEHYTPTLSFQIKAVRNT